MKTAVVIGSGPNGLAAAICLAQAGLRVEVREADRMVGGGATTAQMTLPGFLHDRGSAIHPFALSSPFFRSLPLAKHGLRFAQPPVPLAHPLDHGAAVGLFRSVDDTARQFHVPGDRAWYRRLLGPLVNSWQDLTEDLLRPLPAIPRHPLPMLEFGLDALWPATMLAKRFRTESARALLGGNAAHSFLQLNQPLSSAFALMLLASGHAVGWPVPIGGSQAIADALHSVLRSLGGRVLTSAPVRTLQEVGPADLILCDVTPRQLLNLAGKRLTEPFRGQLHRFRPGPGIFKVDWALREPIPWRSPICRQAGTVHLAGTFQEIVRSEAAAYTFFPSPKPFVILAQPSLFDPSRAPANQHTAWAYCHMPFGYNGSHLAAIESQVERFAPGFRECILARATSGPKELAAWNENLWGGDISAGLPDWQQFVLRPTWRQYATPLPGVYLCSASTPPGGGVHGMCGYWAAMRALQSL